MIIGTDPTNCLSCIDYYGVTFDHLVPADDLNPEVLAITSLKWTMMEEYTRTEGNMRTKSSYPPSIR